MPSCATTVLRSVSATTWVPTNPRQTGVQSLWPLPLDSNQSLRRCAISANCGWRLYLPQFAWRLVKADQMSAALVCELHSRPVVGVRRWAGDGGYAAEAALWHDLSQRPLHGECPMTIVNIRFARKWRSRLPPGGRVGKVSAAIGQTPVTNLDWSPSAPAAPTTNFHKIQP